MNKLMQILVAGAVVVAALPAWSQVPTPPKVYVNEYFGMKYTQEPVSWDVTFDKPVDVRRVSLAGVPSQAEPLEGKPEAATKVRIWALVDFDKPSQQQFEVKVGQNDAAAPITVTDEKIIGGIKTAVVSNGQFWARVPVGSADFGTGASAFDIPGPIVSVSQDGKSFLGSGYLDSILRVKNVQIETVNGPAFFESRITYNFEQDKTYTVKVRLYPGKGFATLTEDFNLGGNARFIFSYDDWRPRHVISCTDQAQVKVFHADSYNANDFVKEEGQRCLVRMVVWTQFGYFGGKSETIGLANDDGTIAVGGFFIRPDKWTRAKVNHVDLYERPEVPGDRMTRGIVGLAGSQPRYAMEAWLVDGHREWAFYAMPTGPITQDDKGGPPKTAWRREFRKAHVVDGVWPLDRLNKLPLVWNPDGTPLTPEETAPLKGAGGAGRVLQGMEGRAGLQEFNGSEGGMRADKTGLLRWAQRARPKINKASDLTALSDFAKANPPKKGEPKPLIDVSDTIADRLTAPAIWTYMAMDESAYPGTRAMLPWTHPEALNPFYQGMENMNFNADRYRCVSQMGAGLAVLGHPEGKKMQDHGEQQMSMSLDRYVYPDSGCWEESHSYALHTVHNLYPLAMTLKEVGGKNFFEDIRFARMFDFFAHVHSPRDPSLMGMRALAPIGDHGGGIGSINGHFRRALPEFAKSQKPEIQKIVGHMAWALSQTGGLGQGAEEGRGNKPGEAWAALPEGVTPQMPNLQSRYVQGYGVTMRTFADAAGKPLLQKDWQKLDNGRESYVILRAEQSWGHHHQDKGSLWGWFRNVRFFGDAAWGSPPGGTYGNSYKQGPASGTQIDFIGVNNWTLPCKYPAPWISDDHYQPGVFDYANARCMYPYNPKLDLTKSSPKALRNGYDRQVLMIHPDTLIVRDNLETVCQTVWRMHGYHVDGIEVRPGGALMKSPHDVTGALKFAYPDNVTLNRVNEKDELEGDKNGVGQPFGKSDKFDTRSSVLRWDMPMNSSATWVFSAFGTNEKEAEVTRLNDAGRVTQIKLVDGRTAIVLMAIEPFTYNANGITFEGTVGVVIKDKSGKATTYAVRASKLTAQ